MNRKARNVGGVAVETEYILSMLSCKDLETSKLLPSNQLRIKMMPKSQIRINQNSINQTKEMLWSQEE